MHMEIAQAADFLGRLLHSKLDQAMLEAFKDELAGLLKERFVNHWDPQQPYRGNGFRAISNFNGQLDPVLVNAAENATVPPEVIHAHLPRDFVLWIDPFSVSYRVGDHGNIMTLFEDRSRGRITVKPTSAAASSQMFMAAFQTPRTSTPIRISPPSSPENRKTKNHIHQSSPLAQKDSPDNGQQQQQQQQQQQKEQQQQQLVLAN